MDDPNPVEEEETPAERMARIQHILAPPGSAPDPGPTIEEQIASLNPDPGPTIEEQSASLKKPKYPPIPPPSVDPRNESDPWFRSQDKYEATG